MNLTYRTVLPSEKTKEIVRFYWFLESDHPYTHYSMADVSPELIFHYRGQFHEVLTSGARELSFVSGLSAPSNSTRKFEIGNGFCIFGTYLYPHAVPLLFNIPANELTNQMIELAALIPKYGASLEDQILNSSSDEQRIAILDSFIENKLSKNSPPELPVFEALKHILHASGSPRVSQLTSDYCLSERQLERQFYRYTGFAPKQFIRISRFHRTMQLYGHKEFNLTDVALACGYYDQSHFISDFKQFSGLNPRTYFSGKSPATLWRDSEVEKTN